MLKGYGIELPLDSLDGLCVFPQGFSAVSVTVSVTVFVSTPRSVPRSLYQELSYSELPENKTTPDSKILGSVQIDVTLKPQSSQRETR